MSPTVQVRPLERTPDCSLCRAPVAPPAIPCPGCRTHHHRTCLEELTPRCPTLGCGALLVAVPATRVRSATSGGPSWGAVILFLLWSTPLLLQIDPSVDGLGLVGWISFDAVVAVGFFVWLACRLSPPASRGEPDHGR